MSLEHAGPHYRIISIILCLSLLTGLGASLATLSLPGQLLVTILLVAVILIVLFLAHPTIMLLLFLFIRPSIDVYRNWGMFLGPEANLNLNALFALVLIMVGSAFVLVRRIKFWEASIAKLFLVFLCLNLVWGFLVSPDKFSMFADILRIFSYLIIFLLSSYLFTSERKIRKLVTVYFLAIVPSLIIGTYQGITRTGLIGTHAPEENINRIFGTFGHPGNMAHYLVFLLIISYSVFVLRQKTKELNAKWLAISMVLFPFIVFTYLRAAWAALLGAWASIAVIRKSMWALVVIALLAVISINIPAVSQRLYGLTSLYARFRIWKYLLSANAGGVCSIFGNGLGFVAYTLQGWGQIFTQAHNDYLRLFIENGVVGLVLYLLMLASILRRAYNFMIADCVSSFYRSLASGVFGMCIAMIILSITDNLLTIGVIQWPIWSYFGSFYGLAENHKKQLKRIS